MTDAAQITLVIVAGVVAVAFIAAAHDVAVAWVRAKAGLPQDEPEEDSEDCNTV